MTVFEIQNKIWEILSQLSSDEVLQLITDWHGLQLFDDDFLEFLKDEGYVE